jgi:neutral ceramidase
VNLRRATVAALVSVAACALPAAPATAQGLRAGVGKADITPRTGYYLGGWTRADRTAQGQHTRLFSRALVLQRGTRKVALVQVDLFMIPGGMVRHIGERLAGLGLTEQNILISASHTHSGPGGYGNFPTLNTAAPSLETATDPFSFVGLIQPQPADPQLYRFLTEQISAAIRRADRDLGPAVAGWGSSQILGLTQNRSIEAHLANHGLELERGQGSEAQDPGGYVHTIDPDVNVLRVDKFIPLRRRGRRGSPPAFTGQAGGVPRRRVPIGAWSTFADHGTVTKSSFEFYNADHHGSALRVFEAQVRRSGRVPASQEVLNVYGNSDEGDMSAGLTRHGPAASDEVGRVEAAAMLRAWREAGSRLSREPALDVRWTRMCFCGQETEGGAVADRPEVGIPFLTGSEEERGPLFDVTGQPLEGVRSPLDLGPHGHKLFPPGASGVPRVVPLLAVRVGPRMIVSVPGEGTKEVGARIRADVERAVAGAGIERVVVSGLANEFILYFTTPEEYARQHYEGGNTHFGTYSSNLLKAELARLAGTLARGEPPPPPEPFDATNGVLPDGPPYGSGAASGSLVAQPGAAYPRLGHAEVAWQGGAQGLDRPVDRAFVIVQRRQGRRWVRADDDLGLAMLWQVDDAGRHRARWEVPLRARTGVHRFVVQAKRYRLVSRPFRVTTFRALTVREVAAPAGRVAAQLVYPTARRDVDLTARPAQAAGGRVAFRVAGRLVRAASRTGTTFSVPAPAGASVTIGAGAARDRFGNANGAAVRLR